MHDEERAASRAAGKIIEREHDARRTRVWPRCLVTLPWPSTWPPREGTLWTRYLFALAPLRVSLRDDREEEHALISRAWGVVRHEGSLRAVPTFEPLTDELVVDGDADVAATVDTSATTPSVGSLLCRASMGELTPSEERRLAGAYLANADRIALTVPRAARETHRDFLAWLARWRAEKPLWVAHDPSDLFADPIADRLAEAQAKEKALQAELEAELAALKKQL